MAVFGYDTLKARRTLGCSEKRCDLLLFSHPKKLAQGINQANLSAPLQTIRNAFDSPEEINNSFDTSPSKRIGKLYPAYDKPIHGSLAAIEIGLDIIRQECQRFDKWLKELEALSI